LFLQYSDWPWSPPSLLPNEYLELFPQAFISIHNHIKQQQNLFFHFSAFNIGLYSFCTGNSKHFFNYSLNYITRFILSHVVNAVECLIKPPFSQSFCRHKTTQELLNGFYHVSYFLNCTVWLRCPSFGLNRTVTMNTLHKDL
jgi:hypothetical protein